MGHHIAVFGGHWSSASGDIKYLICRVTSQSTWWKHKAL